MLRLSSQSLPILYKESMPPCSISEYYTIDMRSKSITHVLIVDPR